MGRYLVGVDLGQSRDFSAIAVLERAEPAELRLRYLERPALGTPYPEVVERVWQITRWGELAGRCHLVVDASGVGRPVVDLLRRAEPGGRLLPVAITSGSRESMDKGYYLVPKRELILGLQAALQGGGLQIAKGLRLGAALAAELGEMRVKATVSGRERYGVWRKGRHDDLVLALALACWGAKKVYPHPAPGKGGGAFGGGATLHT